MRAQFVIPVLASILILGPLASAEDVFAPKKLFVGGLSWDTDSQSFVVTGEVNHGMVKAVEKAGFTLQITINILDTQLTDSYTPSFDADGAFAQSIPWDRILDDGSSFEGLADVSAELQILNPAGKTIGNSVDKFERVLTIIAPLPEVKTVSISLQDEDGNPVSNAECSVANSFPVLFEDSGITDNDGILDLSVPSVAPSLFLSCFDIDTGEELAFWCNAQLNEGDTLFELVTPFHNCGGGF